MLPEWRSRQSPWSFIRNRHRKDLCQTIAEDARCRKLNQVTSKLKSSWQTALYDPQLMFRAFRFLENQVASKLPAS